jgi:glycogen debranching enzyme
MLITVSAVSAVEMEKPAELVIAVEPNHPRSFILANRSGTYFYGSTGESAWDAGWMGLWIHRQRVQSAFAVLDSSGNKLVLSNALCRVTPFDVTWEWDNPRRQLSLFFVSTFDDTLYYGSETGLRVEGGPWIRPISFDSEYQKQVIRWAISSDSRTPPPDGYLPEKIRSEAASLRFSCADKQYSEAVAWAHLQLLFLLAEDDSLLYAGIPWFNEGWGRDTFISLPGLLVTGHTDVARKLLMRYANWVDRNPQSPTYGRVPNRVRPGEEIAYNTADGTPWWILGLYEYGVYSRDITLWSQLLAMPTDSNPSAGAVVIAMRGALARCDSSGFLKHGDADTWMDAIGPGGPVTPRGDRAVEIQALHHASLDAAIRMAGVLHKHFPADTLKAWRNARTRLEKAFLANYLAPSEDRLWDHINRNGFLDSLLRPNQLFALTVPLSPLVPPILQEKITRRACADLVHDYGVLSLGSDEELFHPFHQDDHYPKDDAYHNGIVWTWLSGPAKTLLTRQGRADLALDLADYEAGLILKRGCVGSLPEVTDAMPRKGRRNVALSGTVSQTWSLAEFLRTTYQDILGIRPVFVAGRIEPFWLFDPRIPQAWGRVTLRATLEGVPIAVTMQCFRDSTEITLQAETEPRVPLGIKAFDPDQGITGYLNGTDPVHLVYRTHDGIAYADNVPTAKVTLKGWPYDAGARDLTLALPIKKRDFASLRPPSWDMLTAEQALHSSQSAKEICTAVDPANDDDGSAHYRYPTDEYFASGILDLVKFRVQEDAKSFFFNLEFRNLVQPGWHPEYGFQLTFAAICLQTTGGKRYEVGANSNYSLPENKGASRVIFVGGGVRIEDDSGARLADFIPRETGDAFGDAAAHRVSFALPKKFFPPDARNGSWTVLIGAQDDHGGAGLGEFRTVKPEAERWAGGGNVAGGPNVFDILEVPSPTR